MSSIISKYDSIHYKKDAYKSASPLLLILAGYLVFSIFYIFRSGLPQPADILLVLGIAFIAIGFFTNSTSNVPIAYFCAILFGSYALLINLLHFSYMPDRVFLLSSLFYIYNALIFIFTTSIYTRNPEQFHKYIYPALVIAICLEFFCVIIADSFYGTRAIGTFNNPNQFSYWNLLAACMLIALRYPHKFTKTDYFLLCLIGYMIMLGLSKAASLSFFLIIGFCMISNMFHSGMRYIFFIFIFVTMIFSIFALSVLQEQIAQIESLNNLTNRLDGIGQQSDDSLEGRGYYRVFQHPEYLLFGAGEGGYKRFTTPELPKPFEIHSGIINILFSYGLLCFALFAYFLFTIFRKLPVIFWVLLAAMLFYSITHQNFRFSHTWVFFGMCYGISRRLGSQNSPAP